MQLNLTLVSICLLQCQIYYAGVNPARYSSQLIRKTLWIALPAITPQSIRGGQFLDFDHRQMISKSDLEKIKLVNVPSGACYTVHIYKRYFIFISEMRFVLFI